MGNTDKRFLEGLSQVLGDLKSDYLGTETRVGGDNDEEDGDEDEDGRGRDSIDELRKSFQGSRGSNSRKYCSK
jgi:hypothetical protein